MTTHRTWLTDDYRVEENFPGIISRRTKLNALELCKETHNWSWFHRDDRSGLPWRSGEERDLARLVKADLSDEEIAEIIKRSAHACHCRAEKLGFAKRTHTGDFIFLPDKAAIYLGDSTETETEIKEERGMKTDNMAAIMMEGVRTVSVSFAGTTKQYTYLTCEELQVEDVVVVPAMNEYKTAIVEEIHDTPQVDIDSGIKYKWVVQKIDFTEYDKRMAAERKFSDILKNLQFNKVRHQVKELLKENLGEDSVLLLENALKLD